jgi:hypothetical protein
MAFIRTTLPLSSGRRTRNLPCHTTGKLQFGAINGQPWRCGFEKTCWRC